MIEALEHWQGRVLDINFPLQEYLGGREDSAVFVTEHCDPAPRKAAIKLVPIDPGHGDRELSRAEAAARLRHPDLIHMFQVGLWRRDDLCLLYLTMEYAPENLAPVLSERPLTGSEMREVLLSTLNALAYIHAAGFVHGHLKPSNIMALDDQVKVCCDGLFWAGESIPRRKPSIYDPPEIVTGTITPAVDVWSLAMIMVEGLTQQVPAWEGNERKLVLPERLSDPFLEIARNCLRDAPQRRWTTEQFAACLRRTSSNELESTNASVQGASNLKRYTLPLAAVISALAAILIAGRVPYPKTPQQIAAPRKVIVPRPASKQVPLQRVRKEPEVVQDYQRPSPFGSPETDRVSISKVLPHQMVKSGKGEASETRSQSGARVPAIARPRDTTAANTMQLNPSGPVRPYSITSSNADQREPAVETETGRAAFFSVSANGGVTASGARLNSEELMAAHASYPLGSRVKVTNLGNGKAVEVRIVDRFQNGSKRIVILSPAAARELDFIKAGTAIVRIELVR